MDVMLPSVDSTSVVLHARCDQKHSNSVLMETLRWTDCDDGNGRGKAIPTVPFA